MAQHFFDEPAGPVKIEEKFFSVRVFWFFARCARERLPWFRGCRVTFGWLAVQYLSMTAPAVDYESKNKPRKEFDPDSYRMTIGEHLEELRWRMILGLGAFFVCAIIFLIPQVAEHVVRVFLRPLMVSLEKAHQSPQIYYTEVAESFMVYIKIGLICAAAV